MEQKMKCPFCGRCIGFVQSTVSQRANQKLLVKNKEHFIVLVKDVNRSLYLDGF